ncbi:hypothetical protein VFPPC_15440 [Pochonia chlamydosporia 170]|uniref:Uncharacterized protein n=1 Tax=Pochonia chlamydosporia 170 TaxID=1380566 RepID=A0A179GAY9_METCM|nr:hypothetical protein VFPPC_15440 [Pochonia chlamydosporia 170]OAQ74309.1 hypothetical protein VFPPC_15440 [Pochonia chlamydosporia 170]
MGWTLNSHTSNTKVSINQSTDSTRLRPRQGQDRRPRWPLMLIITLRWLGLQCFLSGMAQRKGEELGVTRGDNVRSCGHCAC